MAVQAHVSLAYPSGKSPLVPKRMGPVLAVTILPVAVVGMMAAANIAKLSLGFALLWMFLVPWSMYRRWAAFALPVVAASLLVFAVLVLPFNSAAFIVNYWTSASLLLLSWPRR
jgi:hypothetical protein